MARYRRTTVISSFSPEAPRRLKTAYRKAGSFGALAALLKVNKFHVHRALVLGIKPGNPKIAERLFFDGKTTPLGDGRHRHIRWWRRLSAQQRNQLIFFLYHYKEGEKVK